MIEEGKIRPTHSSYTVQKFKNRRRLIPAILMLGSLIWAAPSAAFSQRNQTDPDIKSVEFSEESVQGDYSVVGTFGANVAQELGTQKVDGIGNFDGSSIVNEPGPNTTRTITIITFTGTVIIHIPRVRRRGLPWEWEGEEGQLWLR
jgi:hypothetical protein